MRVFEDCQRGWGKEEVPNHQPLRGTNSGFVASWQHLSVLTMASNQANSIISLFSAGSEAREVRRSESKFDS